MVYSNLRLSFIYQIIVGILCILAMLFNGEKMIVLVALMAPRPYILDKKTVRDMTPYRRFYYQVNKISLIITVITLIIIILYYQLLGSLAFEVGLNSWSFIIVIWPAIFRHSWNSRAGIPKTIGDKLMVISSFIK